MGKWILPLTAILFLCFSCAPPAKFLAPNFEKPERVAILPAINQTTDVAGGIVFRNLLYKKLMDKEYTRVIPNNHVDSLLNLQGITDGGQLVAIKDEELFRVLGVDGLIYLELLECTYQSLGISETRHVKTNLALKLYPGNKIWEDEREIKEGKSIFQTIFSGILDPIGTLSQTAQDLTLQYTIKGLNMWLLDHELKPEMDEIINTSFNTLPKSAPVHRPYAVIQRQKNLPIYQNIETTRERMNPGKEKDKKNLPVYKSNMAAQPDRNPGGQKNKNNPPVYKSNVAAQKSRNAVTEKNESNFSVYNGKITAYLTIEAFTTHYFLIYQNDNMNMRIGDAFLIVRPLKNTLKTIGIAEVVKVQGKKVVLDHEMFDGFKISYQDKLKYGD